MGEVSPCARTSLRATPSAGDTPATPPKNQEIFVGIKNCELQNNSEGSQSEYRHPEPVSGSVPIRNACSKTKVPHTPYTDSGSEPGMTAVSLLPLQNICHRSRVIAYKGSKTSHFYAAGKRVLYAFHAGSYVRLNFRLFKGKVCVIHLAVHKL